MKRNAWLKAAILLGTLLSASSTYAEEYERGITVCSSSTEGQVVRTNGCSVGTGDNEQLILWNDYPKHRYPELLKDKDWYVERVEVNHDDGIIVVVHYRYSDKKVEY